MSSYQFEVLLFKRVEEIGPITGMETMSYPFKTIEEKWQHYWQKNNTFKTPEDTSRPKYYVLDMFPYPSGAGLHVGHPEGYTATDIMARYKRMCGFNVLHPMGWDAFGLPAERYAMQTKIHPEITTKKNIENFRRQLQSLGFSYDWEKEINTTSPDYYKWTQWIFLKIFNSWYDEKSNRAKSIEELHIPKELTIKGREKDKENFINSHRLAYIAEMPVNWCPDLGTVLANEEVDEWVSKGHRVERRPMRQWMLRITKYAGRLLDDLKYVDWPAGTLELQKNWIGRSDGAEIKFVLKNYPDKILEVFTTRPDTLFGATYMVLAPEHPFVELLTEKKEKKLVSEYIEKTKIKSDLERTVQGGKSEKTGVFTGGFVIHPLTKESIPVWVADYVLMGYGTGAIMAVPAHDERDFDFAKNFKLPIKQVIAEKNKSNDDELKEAYTADGINIHSDFLNGISTQEAKEKMILHLEKEKIGIRRINYKLRDWLFSRQRYWGEPIPISFDEEGNYMALEEEDLPLLLPQGKDFHPTANGESPLANIKEWVEFKKNGKSYRRETNTMPQWAGSSWYFLRFIDPGNHKILVDKKKEKYWMGESGVDLYIGGAEHAVLHLLYARFWHKILYDLGHVSSPEPFKKLIHQGIILGEDNQKMSKSRGNVVNPDDVLKVYGADSFRILEMFLGPLDQMKPWSSRGFDGVHRFLDRVWRLYTLSVEENKYSIDPELLEETPDELKKDYDRLIHYTIKKVTEDMERLSFNTAISQLMIYVNEVLAKKQIGKFAADSFLLLLSPFAPHIAESLWELLGNKESLAYAKWPEYDSNKVIAEEFEAVFQVNGKIRGKKMVASSITEDELKKEALLNPGVMKFMEGITPKKVIVIKGKLVNIVI